MSTINSIRKCCKDIFNAFLVTSARYAGFFEFPIIEPCYDTPNKLIPFSKCISSIDHDCWVHFYEDDYLFERLWRNPRRYLSILQQFNGIIAPDFSLYRDMPLVMQLWHIYKSRSLAFWLQSNGIKVIPNVRFGDDRTYKCCCDGLPQKAVISVGTHGTIKNKLDREIFIKGLDVVIKRIKPISIVVYGAAPSSIFDKYQAMEIEIIHFESELGIAMNSLKEVL